MSDRRDNTPKRPLTGEQVSPTDPRGQQKIEETQPNPWFRRLLGRTIIILVCIAITVAGIIALLKYPRPSTEKEPVTVEEKVSEDSKEAEAEEELEVTEEMVLELREKVEQTLDALAKRDLSHRNHRILFGQVSSEYEGGQESEELGQLDDAYTAYQASLEASAELSDSLTALSEAETEREKMLQARGQVLNLHGDTVLSVDFNNTEDELNRGEMEFAAGEFAVARDIFRNTGQTFMAQVQELNELFRQSLNLGLRALNRGNGVVARETFARALEIKPEDPFVQAQAKRAETIDEVYALNQSARGWEEKGMPELARIDYQAAVDLDPLAADASAGLERVSSYLAKGIYEESMSEGLSALKEKNGETAFVSFARALAMNPTDTAAQGGVSQAEEMIEEKYVMQQMERGRRALEEGRYSSAVDAYEEALRRKPSLLAARNGFNRALELQQEQRKFEQLLSQADSFEANGQYERALLLLREARQLQNPNNAVSDRIDHLQGILADLSKPVELTLLSDGQTQVDIYPSIGKYQPFREKTIELRPGEYVILGHRPRYRDVRLNLEIRAGEAPEVVEVVCNQPI